MSIDRIHLRKLLKIMFLADGPRRTALRTDIREEIAKDAGDDGGGGDFYAPFWADARAHVFGMEDLHTAVQARIQANGRRSNLYPRLRDGFLRWWTERRRWTNAPFQPGQQLKSNFQSPDLGATVKVDSILSVRDAQGIEHYMYPYFAPEPVLSAEAARLGLWLLLETLDQVPPAEIRILDVIRGETFSIDRYPLLGTEEQNFTDRYRALLAERAALAEEYD
ncbi:MULTISPECIES: hypothetical protein [unclassified Rhizobium]|uniref:hypothetical protein n=1 Tax=unclassified Rhizobium TaxID=2613769 RepID=UPI0006F2EFB7|nr:MULTISPECIES: hypothetical protein [unclassified Rhizobium]KQV35773.1 hypothetical protein ASC86_11285 [Rhizobium sp. Root1212]KRD25880.1 hypothetical protein ASE37_11280 [Rhizobium sp. Root268]